jgi:hypothetical protein
MTKSYERTKAMTNQYLARSVTTACVVSSVRRFRSQGLQTVFSERFQHLRDLESGDSAKPAYAAVIQFDR